VDIRLGRVLATLLPAPAVQIGGTVLVADVHLGKSEVFQRHGIPVPAAATTTTLERLGALVSGTRAAQLVVLGDLVHGALDAALVEAVAAWRSTLTCAVALVRGNHDRHAPSLPPRWRIDELSTGHRLGEIALHHDPADADPSGFSLAGHAHPGALLRSRRDAIRAPAFHLFPHVCILPAFGEFTGSVLLRRQAGDRLVAVVAGELIELPVPPRYRRARRSGILPA
jgi:DNA ligase-associated metallophosphoesterase